MKRASRSEIITQKSRGKTAAHTASTQGQSSAHSAHFDSLATASCLPLTSLVIALSSIHSPLAIILHLHFKTFANSSTPFSQLTTSSVRNSIIRLPSQILICLNFQPPHLMSTLANPRAWRLVIRSKRYLRNENPEIQLLGIPTNSHS